MEHLPLEEYLRPFKVDFGLELPQFQVLAQKLVAESAIKQSTMTTARVASGTQIDVCQYKVDIDDFAIRVTFPEGSALKIFDNKYMTDSNVSGDQRDLG